MNSRRCAVPVISFGQNIDMGSDYFLFHRLPGEAAAAIAVEISRGLDTGDQVTASEPATAYW